uniref:Proteoglycan 4-like n=1 Tax=Panagrellus redivivus TaxID=6233 RepID=A0A7E4VSK2_PANRE
MKLFWGLLLLGGTFVVVAELDDSFEAKLHETYNVDVEDDLLAIYGDDYTLFEEPVKHTTRPERYHLDGMVPTNPAPTDSLPPITTESPVSLGLTSTVESTTEPISTVAPTTEPTVTSEETSTVQPSTEAPTTKLDEISTAEPSTTSTSLPLTTSTKAEVPSPLPSTKTTIPQIPTTTEAPKPTIKPELTKEEVAQAIENVLDIVDKYVFKDDAQEPYYEEFKDLALQFDDPLLLADERPMLFEVVEPQEEASPLSAQQRSI